MQHQDLPEEQKELRANYIFRVTNQHSTDCGQPPSVDNTRSSQYRSYFENEHSEQAIFVYDYTTGEGTLYMGDAGWENPVRVEEGRAKGLILHQCEEFWLMACWLAATKSVLEPGGTLQREG